MSSRRQLVQINPTNQATAYSFRGGTNTLIFDIPMTPAILNGKSVSINGTFNTFTGVGDARPTNRSSPDGIIIAGQPGAGGATTQDVFIDPRTGVNSCIDFLTIQSLEGSTYEQIKNYNRMCASILPLQEGIKSYLNGGVNLTYGAVGKTQQQGRMCDTKINFSLPLLAGFLQGNPIDLQLVRGLRITITLASDLFVCGNNFWKNGIADGGTTDSGAFFNLTDVNMSYELEVPDSAGQQAMVANTSGSWDYNAYSSFYQVIQSTDMNAVMNVNTSRTIGTIMNYIPSQFLNNYNYNSNWATKLLTPDAGGRLTKQLDLEELTFTKGGLRIPLDFEVRTLEEEKEGVATSQKNFEELNAIRNVWAMSSFMKDLRTELSLNGTAGVARFKDSMTENDALSVNNIGVKYDGITGNGLNFKGTPLGLRLQSSPPVGTPLDPHSLFAYVYHKNTIMFQNGQVSVMN
tara:strand:+ start:2638 stop:4020 length:1383 start_codon:yes stop_codon:yes gene_type:complete